MESLGKLPLLDQADQTSSTGCGIGGFVNIKLLSSVSLIMALMAQLMAEEFSLSSKDGQMYGPFAFEEGAAIKIRDQEYLVKNVGKFGESSFSIEEDAKGGAKYGPFFLKNNTRITIQGASFVLYRTGDSGSSDSKKPLAKPAPSSNKTDSAPAETTPEASPKEESKKNVNLSNTLNDFEDALDYVESNFSNAAMSERNSIFFKDYENKLLQFKVLSRKLQDEISRFQGYAPDQSINFPKYALVFADAFKDCSNAFFSAPDNEKRSFYMPALVSTRRNHRPMTNSANARSSVSYENYSDVENLNALQDIYRTNLRRRQNASSGKLSVPFIDAYSSVVKIRAMLVQIEKLGYWRTLERNGQVYRLNPYR